MTNRLFDGGDLVEVAYGDGGWTRGFDLQAATAATVMTIIDPCSEAPQYVAGTPNASPNVYHVTAFSAEVSARRNVRCAIGEELDIVQGLLTAGGSVGAAEYALWNGSPGWDPNVAPSLQNADIKTVSATSGNVAETLASVIVAYSDLTVLNGYVLHLGIKAALDLSAQGYTYSIDVMGNLRLRATDAPIVVSPYYPAAGVAITGPIEINVGDVQAFQTYDAGRQNRTNITGFQLMTVAFDPSTSVRAV